MTRAIMHAMSQETHTLVHLRELEDDAAKGGFGETLEARFARDALGCKGIGMSLQRVKPGARWAFPHRHSGAEEIYLVLAGAGRAIVDGDLMNVGPWDALRVAATSARSFEAGDDGLEFVAFGTHVEGDRGDFVDEAWPS